MIHHSGSLSLACQFTSNMGHSHNSTNPNAQIKLSSELWDKLLHGRVSPFGLCFAAMSRKVVNACSSRSKLSLIPEILCVKERTKTIIYIADSCSTQTLKILFHSSAFAIACSSVIYAI